MREILFRGKQKENGEWVEGFPVRIYDYGGLVWDMHPFNTNLEVTHSVIPNSIGQFTGLTDKNGTKIFEGDMFRMDEDDIAVVIFKDGCFRLEIHGMCGTYTESGFDECGGGYGIIECDPIDWYYIRDMEVIGNIHDNPELLDGAKDG